MVPERTGSPKGEPAAHGCPVAEPPRWTETRPLRPLLLGQFGPGTSKKRLPLPALPTQQVFRIMCQGVSSCTSSYKCNGIKTPQLLQSLDRAGPAHPILRIAKISLPSMEHPVPVGAFRRVDFLKNGVGLLKSICRVQETASHHPPGQGVRTQVGTRKSARGEFAKSLHEGAGGTLAKPQPLKPVQARSHIRQCRREKPGYRFHKNSRTLQGCARGRFVDTSACARSLPDVSGQPGAGLAPDQSELRGCFRDSDRPLLWKLSISEIYANHPSGFPNQ